jgi:hypothetical protein
MFQLPVLLVTQKLTQLAHLLDTNCRLNRRLNLYLIFAIYSMTNQLMTILMWAIAVAHVMTSRLLWPFVQSLFNELTTEVPAVVAPPVLTVAVTDAPVKEPATKTPVTPRPARRRRSTAKVAA